MTLYSLCLHEKRQTEKSESTAAFCDAFINKEMIGTCLFTQIERSVEQALILPIAAKGLHEYRAMLRCEISTFMRSCPATA